MEILAYPLVDGRRKRKTYIIDPRNSSESVAEFTKAVPERRQSRKDHKGVFILYSLQLYIYSTPTIGRNTEQNSRPNKPIQWTEKGICFMGKRSQTDI